MNTVRFRFLGGFALARVGDAPYPIRISSRKGCALLAYLAMLPEHVAPREQAATLLWGDRSDKQARQDLRQCLASLRQDLEQLQSTLIVSGDDVIGLDGSVWTADACEFLRLAATNDVGNLMKAAELYCGPFLAGLSVVAEGFEDWLRRERMRFESLAAEVLHRLAEHLDRSGRSMEAFDAIERLVAIDPLREDWQRFALQVYARHRGREAAMAYARTLSKLFKNELAIAPEPATLALIDDIKRGSIAPLPRFAAALGADALPGTQVEGATRPIRGDLPRVAGWAISSRHIVVGSLVAVAVLAVGAWQLAVDPRHKVEPKKTENPAVERSISDWRAPTRAVGNPSQLLSSEGIVPVIVLPFKNSDEPGSSGLSLATLISQDLTNVLSHTPRLAVISHHTAQFYADGHTNVATIGRELGVRYVIEGSLRVNGDAARVNVALTDAATQLQVWSDQIEREKLDRWAIQDEIVRGLGRRLDVAVIDLQARENWPALDGEPVAGLHVIKGWAELVASQKADRLNESRAAFTSALQRDPNLASARVGLAAVRIYEFTNMVAPDRDSTLNSAKEMLERVLSRWPGFTMALYWRGIVHKLQGEHEAALKLFQESVARNPSAANAYGQIGAVLVHLHRASEALDHLRYAMRLSAKDPTLPLWTFWAGQAELELDHVDKALEWFTQTAALNPNSAYARAALAAAYALNQEWDKAAAEVSRLRQLTPAFSDDQRIDRFRGVVRLREGLRVALSTVK